MDVVHTSSERPIYPRLLGNEILLRQMSREDMEIVRRIFEVFARDGFEGLLRHLDPEIEWTTTGSYIDRATYRGHDGVRRYLGSMLDEFEDFRIEPVEFIDAGEQVIVITRVSGRGKRSRAPVELTLVDRRESLSPRWRTSSVRAGSSRRG